MSKGVGTEFPGSMPWFDRMIPKMVNLYIRSFSLPVGSRNSPLCMIKKSDKM